MNNAENSSAKEEAEMIEFQTKANFKKVAGNDGKSQFTFFQLADKKQIDYTVVNQRALSLEEVARVFRSIMILIIDCRT